MRGFTLIELIIVTAILSTTLSVGIPNFRAMLENHHARISLYTLRKILHKSRILALEYRIKVTVCPLKEKQCSNDWSNPLIAFNDINSDQVLDDNERVFMSVQNTMHYGFWQKKKATQSYINFTPLGHAFGSATTFLYCPNSGYDSAGKQLVISFQGRVRTNSYLSNRGTPYANLAPLSCDQP